MPVLYGRVIAVEVQPRPHALTGPRGDQVVVTLSVGGTDTVQILWGPPFPAIYSCWTLTLTPSPDPSLPAEPATTADPPRRRRR